ncbi:hypothetical protein SDC9_196800 [bioreactor metagenome]|uniref:Uncharacterized protein n=1 Tax=bioreactor metagenome TaxID=1076179 RepID=A0A645ID08_9ZZZZ
MRRVRDRRIPVDRICGDAGHIGRIRRGTALHLETRTDRRFQQCAGPVVHVGRRGSRYFGYGQSGARDRPEGYAQRSGGEDL